MPYASSTVMPSPTGDVMTSFNAPRREAAVAAAEEEDGAGRAND